MTGDAKKMNLRSRMVAAFAMLLGHPVRAPQARYEGGQRYSIDRSLLPDSWVRDARFDANTMARYELVAKSRYFERNNGIYNRIADLFEQYTVGSDGFQFVPASSDRVWNQKAKAWWDRWCEIPDVASNQSFGTFQSLTARTWLVDGEGFIPKTSGKPRPDGKSYPRIQLLESQRVATPIVNYGDQSVHDGVRLDARGRPLSYFIRQAYLDDTFQEVPADRIIYIGEPPRTGMVRALPFCYPVINDLHDLDDLQSFEKKAAKDAAITTEIVTNKAGEANEDDLFMQRTDNTDTTGAGTSGGSAEDRAKFYERVLGPRAKYMQPGDDYKQFVSQRPSVAQQQFWDYLVAKICAGIGISKLLVMPFSMQGTVTRSDLDTANAFFRSRSSVLASKFTQIYLYVMDWAVKNEPELQGAPADWHKVKVRPPKGVNVDVGRNSMALINEYLAGIRTLESICGELGEDWREVIEQRAEELAEMMSTEKSKGLPSGSLSAYILQSMANLKAMEDKKAAREETP